MKAFKDMTFREKADDYFTQAAWSYVYSNAGYVELFLKQANYYLNKANGTQHTNRG